MLEETLEEILYTECWVTWPQWILEYFMGILDYISKKGQNELIEALKEFVRGSQSNIFKLTHECASEWHEFCIKRRWTKKKSTVSWANRQHDSALIRHTTIYSYIYFFLFTLYPHFKKKKKKKKKSNGDIVNFISSSTTGWNSTKLVTTLPLIVRLCESNIIFPSVRPSIRAPVVRPSVRHVISS